MRLPDPPRSAHGWTALILASSIQSAPPSAARVQGIDRVETSTELDFKSLSPAPALPDHALANVRRPRTKHFLCFFRRKNIGNAPSPLFSFGEIVRWGHRLDSVRSGYLVEKQFLPNFCRSAASWQLSTALHIWYP
jgi:hypothetical protein